MIGPLLKISHFSFRTVPIMECAVRRKNGALNLKKHGVDYILLSSRWRLRQLHFFDQVFKHRIDRWVIVVKDIYLLQVLVGHKMMTRRQQTSKLSNVPLPTKNHVFVWKPQHIYLAMKTLTCSPILFSNLQDGWFNYNK